MAVKNEGLPDLEGYLEESGYDLPGMYRNRIGQIKEGIKL